MWYSSQEAVQNASSNGDKINLSSLMKFPSGSTKDDLKGISDERLTEMESNLLFRQYLDSFPMVGREKEIQEMLGVFDRIQSHEESELILVKGASGCGKNALVETFCSQLPVGKFLLGIGKFDQLKQSDAVAVISQACNQLFQLIAEEHMKDIRMQLAEALGVQCNLILQQIPVLSELLHSEDEQGEPRLDFSVGKLARANFSRIKMLYRTLFRCLTSFYPIVLFLDDLQWSDEPSRQLLQSLVLDPQSKHLLIVCAVRNDSTVNLEKSLRFQISQYGVSVDADSVYQTSDCRTGLMQLDLDNFNLETVHAFIQLITKQSGDTYTLATLVHSMTNGNPFFIKQYLSLLQSRGFIRCQNQLAWEFDIPAFQNDKQTIKTVFDVLNERVQILPKSVQAVLQAASYLGHRFSAQILGCIETEVGSTSIHGEEVKHILDVGVQYGLLEKGDGDMYHFLHDSVQELFYMSIDHAHEREKLHLSIGQKLLQASSALHREDSLIYQAVDNMNRGSAHIQRIEEREELVSWNLKAARRAALETMPHAALAYLRKSIGLMDESKWDRHYQLTLTTFCMAADMALATANVRECKQFIEEVYNNSHTKEDRISAVCVDIELEGRSGDVDAAISLALAVLKVLEEPVPLRSSRRTVVFEFLRARSAIGDRSEDELLSIRPMVNAKKLICMKVLSLLLGHSYQCGSGKNKNIFEMTILRMVRLSCRFGLSAHSPVAFCGFGVIFANMGFYDEAIRFGNLAAQMIDRCEDRSVQCSMMFMQLCMVSVWRKTFVEVRDLLFHAFHLGVAHANLDHAHYSFLAYLYCSFVTDTHIDELIQALRIFVDEVSEYHLNNVLWIALPMLQTFLKLRGNEENPQYLSGNLFDYDALVDKIVSSRQIVPLVTMKTWEIFLRHSFDCDTNLPRMLEYVERHRKIYKCPIASLSVRAYIGYAAFTMYVTTRQRKYLVTGRNCARELLAWSRKGVVMAHAMGLFVHACVFAASQPRKWAASERAFQAVIEAAKKTRQLDLEAAAHERIVPILLTQDDAASRHLLASLALYERLGWAAKVDHLRKRFPHIIASWANVPASPNASGA